MSRATRRLRSGALVVLVAVLALGACTSVHVSAPPALPSPPTTGPPPSPAHPNIVFVLTDDLSWNLVKYMPHVLALEHAGMTFTDYTVADSLCCPSRASIFTGKYPHDTHVITNTPPNGGYEKFQSLHEDRSTFATSLLRAGYRTAFMGKYLNGYRPSFSSTPLVQATTGAYVPPGWTSWFGVGDGGYAAYNYTLADGHKVQRYGDSPNQYLNSVMTRRATRFIRSESEQTTAHPNPFMLEIASFSPHKPWIPAPQDKGTFAGLRMPVTPQFNRLPRPTPAWMRNRTPLDAAALHKIRVWFRLRVQVVQSVDRMIASLEQTLAETGQAKNTVFVFSSDNGYHLGEHTLESGKQTAFDTDIRVPLVVAGPGIPRDRVSSAMAQNVDLRPTLEDLAGAATPPDVDGHSLVPVLHGTRTPWRTYALVEHHKPSYTTSDPDVQHYLDGVPPSYSALRTTKFLYVRYVTGEREYYDLTRDPNELHDLGPSLPKRRIAALDRIMTGLVTCHGSSACWRAGVPAER